MNTHMVKLCSFTQKKVQNECFISPGDFRVPKLSTDLEPKFMSHKRHSLRQKRQEYAQHQASNSQQSEIVQNIEINMFLAKNAIYRNTDH